MRFRKIILGFPVRFPPDLPDKIDGEAGELIYGILLRWAKSLGWFDLIGMGRAVIWWPVPFLPVLFTLPEQIGRVYLQQLCNAK